MDENTINAVAELIQQHAKVENVDTSEIRTIPLEPHYTTYEMDGYWIKCLNPEPKNRDWTPLHREQYALNAIHKFNRSTVDYKLHIPAPAALHVESSDDILGHPFLLLKGVKGKSLLSYFQDGDKIPANLIQDAGRLLGVATARLHAIQIQGAGLINAMLAGVHPGPWPQYFALLIETQWKRLKGSGVLPDAMLDRFSQLTNAAKPTLIGETVGLVHNNLHFSNVFVDETEEKKKLSGLVNLTQVGAGSPMVDIVAFSVHCADRELFNAFYEGYTSIRSTPPKYEIKRPLYTLVFAMQVAWMFHMRKDENNKGYYLRRAFEAAAEMDSGLKSEIGKYAAYDAPRFTRS